MCPTIVGTRAKNKNQQNSFNVKEKTETSNNKEIKGTILIAFEGVNGTVCGPEAAITQFIEILKHLLKTLYLFVLQLLNI